MTNEQIIFNARVRLMTSNMIGTTGRKITIMENGQEKLIDEPAEIHTYAGWKRLGYQVRRGEKSRINIPIWTAGNIEGNENEQSQMFMFQRNASFFTPEQVDPIEEESNEVSKNTEV